MNTRPTRRASLAAALLCCLAPCLPAACAGHDPGPAAFDVAALRPYFAEGPGQDALRQMQAGDGAAAARFFAAYLKDHPRAPDRNQARFLWALAELPRAGAPSSKATAGQALGAARRFDELAKDYPLLRDYHHLYAGRAYLLAEQPREALSRAQQVAADSPLACEARYVRGEAERRLGDPQGAIREYASYQEGCEGGGHGHEVMGRLAELYAQSGDTARAYQEWHRLYLVAPTESWGALADRQLEAAPPAAAAQRRFTARELLGRAQVLFDNMRNPESEVAYRQVLEARDLPDVDDEVRCTAQFQLAQSVFKQRQRPRAAPLFDEAVTLCAKALLARPDPKVEDMHMKALYQGARCHGSKGELQVAADLFAQAEAAHPGHSYADDARLRQAEMYADLAEKLQKAGPRQTCDAPTCPDYEARLSALLQDLPVRYPDGDQRDEALWRLAFRAYRKRDFARARAVLEDSLQRIPRESGWDQEGRTMYWLGRVAEQEGRAQEATGYFHRAVKEYPLSFYCLLSLSRLSERDPADLRKLLDEVNTPPPGTPANADEWRFSPRPLFGQPGFLRAVELLRLGLGSEAQRELQALGIKASDAKGQRVASPEQEELLWLTAVLYRQAGQFYLSHWIPRHTLTAYQRGYPVGTWRKQWLLSYPRGYEALLTQAAQQDGQPEALQFAIVREESAFDPLTESFANAIGLTQMIPPTAKRFANGLPTTREALRDPATNVAIGGRFLGFLWSTMRGNPALAIAGYNAGEGAVFRWLGARGDLDLDAWIEAIPYDETRGYTKRVLSSYLVYSWLYPGSHPGELAARLPLLPLKLPQLPQARVDGKDEDPHRK